VSSEAVASALQRLAEVLQTQRTLGATLAALAETAVTSVPGCTAASIAISADGRPATAAVSARVALELDLVQYDDDAGPCLQAFNTLETLRLDLREPREAFPHFARMARERGVVAVLSVPATWGDDLVATLNLYSRTGPFDESAVAIGAVLAIQVGIAVSRSPEFAAAREVVEQAQRDSDDQADIEVATGLLMATQDCTPEQAAGLLRAAAIEDEQTILQIAQRIIDQHNTSG
jgi:GAF domain-containing protein